MYKFKNSLVAIGGLLALTGLIALMTPHKGYGSGGNASAGPASQPPTNVNVINTPAVNAQQSGEWNVGINGTPTVDIGTMPSVQVNNAASNPVLMRDVNNQVRQPFQTYADILMRAGTGNVRDAYIYVPSGKRLVIEHLSAQALVPPGQKICLQVLINSAANSSDTPQVFFWVPLQSQGGPFLSGSEVLTGNVQLNAYADSTAAGVAAITIQALRQDECTGDARILCTVSGYLVDIP